MVLNYNLEICSLIDDRAPGQEAVLTASTKSGEHDLVILSSWVTSNLNLPCFLRLATEQDLKEHIVAKWPHCPLYRQRLFRLWYPFSQSERSLHVMSICMSSGPVIA